MSPTMSEDSHYSAGASVGVSCRLVDYLYVRNRHLYGKFGGYTAHHPIALEDVRGRPETQENRTETLVSIGNCSGG